MQPLEQWLSVATKGLCESAAAQVRDEINEHYLSALESAEADGDPLEVERRAVAALGDAKTANREYRRVLLTEAEEIFLRRLTPKADRVRAAIATLVAAVAFAFMPVGTLSYLKYMLPTVAIEGVLRILPVASRRAGRLVRVARCSVLTTGLAMSTLSAFDDRIRYAAGIISFFGPVVHFEYKLFVIRRKLPVDRWPKRLWV